jgi:hypothetical protein
MVEDKPADESRPSDKDQDAIIAKARESIDYFAVGLVHVGDPMERVDIARFGGSGTLVQANGRFGILTAAHVIREFQKHKEGSIGVAFYDGSKGRETVRLGVTRTWWAEKDGPKGPDLGVIVLNPNDASRLSSTHPFYRLDDTNRQAQLRELFDADNGGWLLVGGVGDWSDGPLRAEGSHNVKMFGGLILGPRFLSESVRGPDDFLEFEVDYRENPDSTPETFEGMSGGGVWHMLPSPDRTMMFYLGGVIYYQSSLFDNRRTLYCHGRRSVYVTAAGALAAS